MKKENKIFISVISVRGQKIANSIAIYLQSHIKLYINDTFFLQYSLSNIYELQLFVHFKIIRVKKMNLNLN